MSLLRLVPVLVAVALAFATTTIAQRTTIPQALSKAGVSLRGASTTPSGPPPAVGEFLKHVDAIVIGIIGESRSYLSEDETEVWTDHQLERPVTLFQREVMASPRPGIAAAITVTVPGGTISWNGLTYVSEIGALPPLERGTKALFLLKRQETRYVLVGDIYGVFRYSDGRWVPHTRKDGFAAEYEKLPAAHVEEDIVGQVRRLHPQD